MTTPAFVGNIDPGSSIDGWSAWAVTLGRELDHAQFTREFGAIYDEVGGHKRTRMAWQRFGQLGRLARLVVREGIPGCYAEFGTWRGGSLYLVARQWHEMNEDRDLLGFDSFAGLPEPDPVRDGHRLYAGMFADADYDETVRFFAEQGLPRVQLVRGWFEDTIGELGDRQLALCHIDADCYAGVKFSLERTFEQTAIGGYVVFDDYQHPDCSGATIAVEEFFARRPEIIRHTPGIDCSCWIRKEA